MSGFEFEKIEYSSQFTNTLRDLKLFSLYHDCFSQPPYEEQFDEPQVISTFQFYSTNGILLIGKDLNTQSCVAFAAAIPLKEEREISVIANECGLNLDQYWYAADLGVSSNYRRRKVATKIVKRLILEVPSDRILMRTQENNIASQKCNMAIGFKIIPGMKQEVKVQRTTGDLRSDNRIFLQYVK